MLVKSRVSKIKALTPKVRPLVSKHGKLTYFEMPGSKKDDKYHVAIPEKPTKDTVEGIGFFQCNPICHHLPGDSPGMSPCKGNTNGMVCYHSLAALKVRSENHVVFADSFLSAVRLLSFGGTLIKVINQKESGAVWGVYKNDN